LKFIHQRAQPSAKAISLHGVAHPAANGVGGRELLGRVDRLDVVNPKGATAALARGLREPRELPTGADPSRHTLRPSGSGDPCCVGP